MKSQVNIQQEITPLNEDDFFIIRNFKDAKFDYALHQHSDFELNMVIDSYGTRCIGDSLENFGNLDIVLIGPHLPHIWNGVIEKGNHVVTLQFHDTTINYPILQKRIFKPIHSLLASAGRGIVFEGDRQKAEIRDKILRLTECKGIHSATGFLALLDFMSDIPGKRPLASASYQSTYFPNNTRSRRISKVCDFVSKNYSCQIKLSDISTIINMSESAFCHFFKKKTGKNFVDYLNEVRIGHAARMLYETTDSISEICYSCGFNNLSNFIRVFKKLHMETPSEYRKKMQEICSKF